MNAPRPTPAAADQREVSRLRILEEIRAADRIARIDIASATGLSPATVTAITADMLEEGLIEEISQEAGTGGAKAKRGRPRVLLKLRGEAHRIAGLKVSQKSIAVLLVDFSGTEIALHEHDLRNARMSGEELADEIKTAVAATCAKAGIEMRTLSGIAIGLPGQIDAAKGFVHWSSSLTERNVQFGDILARKLSSPVFIDNDANLVAIAEQLFGDGQGYRNFLVVTIEHGVGMGIVLDGKLYRGARGCGAEFGHTKVQNGGALCQCGQRGCLEAYVGDYALLREANIQTMGERPNNVGDVLAAAREGDRLAQSVLDRAGQMFAMGLSNLINIFDPQLIVLSGAQIAFDHLYEERVLDSVKRSVVEIDAPLPEIKVHHWGDLMWAKGAAAYGIEQVSARAAREVTNAIT
ncbi:ROK family transcriptional regulator [Ruegeria sp. 2205SS24-7]|uniref:ROK family transcriptional regulator n=1 Tax=Ruegeria discodermiae TaxID=3064389 RepID=UPI0027412B37|nr:ROK family transcriptional regulator [Ruegeria sp. 2205SS24-7]MDP5217707.1 ROK family transcriptional regulator [Ruegeria sp. 2205SS24-7]